MKKRRSTKKVASFALRMAIRGVGAFFYVFGLTLFIPLLLFIQFPNYILTLRFLITLITAITFVSLGFFIVNLGTSSVNKTLFRLSLATLIPVAIATIVSFYSVDAFFATVQLLAPDFEVIRPLVDTYIETTVPRIGFMAYAYVIIGLGMLYASYKVKK